MNRTTTNARIGKGQRFKTISVCFFLVLISLFGVNSVLAQQSQTVLTTVSTSPYVVPSDITRMRIELWGGGGAGGGLPSTNQLSSGGGAGGSYTKGASNVLPSASINFTVGAGGAGVTNATGGSGGTSTFNSTTVLSAVGGAGGTTTTGASLTTGITMNGGAGANGVNGGAGSSGGGGGGAGSTGSGGSASGATGGAGGTGDATGTGGTGRNGQSAAGIPLAATGLGAGGGGARNTNGAGTALRAGGAGSSGQIRLTYYLYSLTGTSASSPVCAGANSTIGLTASATGLPTGAYTVTYNLSGATIVTGLTASMTVTTAGTGSFAASGFTSAGSTTVTVTNLQSVDFGSRINTNNTANITVNASPTITAISAPSALCSGGSLNPTTPTVTANGLTVTSQGWQLETAVGSGVFASLTVPYTVAFADNGKKIRYTATNGCGTTNSNEVTVTVNANNTAGAASSTPTLCINTALTNITHTTTGATGIGSAIGLPTGVTAAWASNTITISGTPSVSGPFSYTIPLTGGCGSVNATGTITVNPDNTVGAASSTPTLCINTVLTNITHATTTATGIGTPTGLPSGVTAAWATNTITISGTPTASGTFNYSIPLTGGCGSFNATGTITVTPNNVAGAASSTPTLCLNTVLTDITHSTTGATGIGTPTGLPAGVTAAWASNTITISGTPTASGTFNYSIPLTGGCGSINATGTITVNATTSWVGTTSSSWNDASNWSCGIPGAGNNVDITTNSPNAPILDVDFTLASGKTLTISGTGSLTIASQSNLTIAGTADFGSKSVIIKSDSNGTGAIGEISGSLSNANNVTVERYIPLGKRAFRFLTPGVTTTTFISGNWQQATHITGSTTGANGFDATASGGPSMYTYNNTVASGTGWTAIANTNATNLESGLGYRLLIRGDRTPSLLTNAAAANMNTAITLSATGTLKTGQVVLNSSSTPAINNTSNTTTNGFSLVGNPYVCSVDWHAVGRSGLLDTYYAWDANMGTVSQRGRYVAYSVATGFNSLGNSGSSQVGRYIQPGQAFFVRNTTLGTAGTLTFDENDKADTYTSVFRNQLTTDSGFSKLGLLVYEPNELALGSSPIDGAVAFFGTDFTNTIDSGDVEKLESAGENLAWFNSNQKLAMSTMAPVSDNDELLLKTLRFTANKSYTFKFEPADFDASVTATLVDQFLNTQTPIDLTQDVFVTVNTTADASSFGEDRFKIIFNTEQLGNPDFESAISLYPNPSSENEFYLNLPTWSDDVKIVLFNALGQQIPVSMGSVDGMTRQFKAKSNLTSGVYYIKITQNGKEATKKWILNN